MNEFFSGLKDFVKQFWPAFAVMFWDYEEGKVDRAVKEKEAAELVAKNLTDEKTIRDGFAGKSDLDIINSFGGEPSAGAPVKPKPGSGS